MGTISLIDTKKIKHRMLDLGITNREIARRLHLRDNTLSRYINGRRKNPGALKKVARILKLRPEDIVRSNGEKAA